MLINDTHKPSLCMMARLQPASTHRTALLCVDIQSGLDIHCTTYYGKTCSNPSFEEKVTWLLSVVRGSQEDEKTRNVHIIHVHHDSSDPESPLHPTKLTHAPHPCAAPASAEVQLTKTASSAFIGTNLAERLCTLGVKQVLVMGISTDHCVSSTVRMAADLEVCGTREGVWLVEDCTRCFDSHGTYDAEVVQNVTVRSLKDEFCGVTNSTEVFNKVLAQS
jgi:nicotinamidase-related amidase